MQFDEVTKFENYFEFLQEKTIFKQEIFKFYRPIIHGIIRDIADDLFKIKL